MVFPSLVSISISISIIIIVTRTNIILNLLNDVRDQKSNTNDDDVKLKKNEKRSVFKNKFHFKL